MLEKPNLSDGKIISALQLNYDLSIKHIQFLPIGNDATAWVYHVETHNGAQYFLKVKSVSPSLASLQIPRLLHDKGIAQVVAPLPAQNSHLTIQVGSFTLILYPHIEGTTGMETGLTPTQWTEFGRVMKKIHTLPLSTFQFEGLATESFISPFLNMAGQLQVIINQGRMNDIFQRELAQFWRSHQSDIDRILARTQSLSQICRQKAPNLVICHADIHTANILVPDRTDFFIVDWDETLLAPIERDLMFIGGDVAKEAAKHGKIVGDEETNISAKELFYQGYGEVEIDPAILAYYRYEWVVQEIGDFGQRVFLMAELGEETKRHSVEEFIVLFDSGDVVEAAFGADPL
ncbi:MAG: aminoglycoside phosphotransferase family protein [Chloroflexota bacterium]